MSGNRIRARLGKRDAYLFSLMTQMVTSVQVFPRTWHGPAFTSLYSGFISDFIHKGHG